MCIQDAVTSVVVRTQIVIHPVGPVQAHGGGGGGGFQFRNPALEPWGTEKMRQVLFP